MHPKFYFFDPGIVRALSKKLTVPLEPRSSEFGRAFEHFIILEIMRATEYRRMDLSFSYYRTESGTEVDLIIETPRNKTIAIEIKGRDTIDSPHLHGLYSFSQLRPDATLCCVCLAPYVGQQGKVTILPWQQMVEWIAGQ